MRLFRGKTSPVSYFSDLSEATEVNDSPGISRRVTAPAGTAQVVPSFSLAEPKKDNKEDRIAAYFDKCGWLDNVAPKYWALAACQHYPRHEKSEHQDNLSGLSTRRKQLNAKRCLDRDKRRIEKSIAETLEEYQAREKITRLADSQHQRQLKLMFEPLGELPFEMNEELSAEMDQEPLELPVSPKTPKQTRKTGTKKQSEFGIKSSMGRYRGNGDQTPGQKDDELDGDLAKQGAQINNAQRVLLLSVFQNYVQRVCGPSRAELMKRSTWFRFLHHCGILGPAVCENLGGVTFAFAAKVFEKFAESWAKPPALTFLGWSHAVQFVLRGPGLEKSDTEAFESLFEVFLVRCKARMPPPNSTSRASQVSGTSSQASSRRRRPSKPGTTQKGPLKPVPEDDMLGWHISAAEEQMCEPEVLSMVQSYIPALQELYSCAIKIEQRKLKEQEELGKEKGKETPAQHLQSPSKKGNQLLPGSPFRQERHSGRGSHRAVQAVLLEERTPSRGSNRSKHFRRSSHDTAPEANANGNSGNMTKAKSEPAEPSTEAPRNLSRRFQPLLVRPSSNEPVGLPDKNPEAAVLSPESFRGLCEDLELFPDVIQLFSLRQHLILSSSRCGKRGLDFPGFVESLARIAFVYLSFYGNSVQQMSPSKWKCLWLFTMLRVRCHTYGEVLQLTPAIVGKTRRGGARWNERDPFDLDATKLESLVFWSTIDSNHVTGELPDAPVYL